VPRHVARLVTRLVAPLVVDYSASRRLVVDYSASRRPIVDYSTSRKLVVDYFASVRASGCLGMSRGSSRGSSRRSSWTTPRRAGSSSTTSPRASSSSTTSPPSRVRVPRHVARLVTRLAAPLVVDYFAFTAHPGASARRAVHHTACRAVRRRLLRLA
jgi:hypothetical protein